MTISEQMKQLEELIDQANTLKRHRHNMDTLTQAIAEYNANNPLPEYPQSRGEVGDIVLVSNADGTKKRFMLIISNVIERLTAFMVTNDIDMATDLDVVVKPDDTGAPWTLMVQPELYVSLTMGQLGHVVGRVPIDIVDGLRDALRSDGESVEAYRVGAPLGGPTDPRRRFKREELKDLVTFRFRGNATMNEMLASLPHQLTSASITETKVEGKVYYHYTINDE